MNRRAAATIDSPIRVALEIAAKRFADDVADILEGLTGAPEWYDQNNSPLGKRPHLDAARDGEIPSVRRGKKILVRREDMDRYLASHARVKATARTVEDDIMEAAGLKKVRNGS